MGWPNEFNEDLKAYLGQKASASPALHASLQYAIATSGKRLRPRFAIESAQMHGLNPEATRLFSFAIELVHLFSLVHDDLPALDNDDLRRGVPTLHKKFNEGIALLAGDELLNFAHETFLHMSAHTSPQAFITAFQYFIQSIGSLGMIGGQTLELELSEPGHTPSLEKLLSIQDLKTGALFRASILVPALLSGIEITDPKALALTEYANAFGFAFQIADDLEDEIQDQMSAKKNILSLMGRESAIELALNRLRQSDLHSHFSATELLIQKLTSKN